MKEEANTKPVFPDTPPKEYENAHKDGIAPMCNEGARKDQPSLCGVRIVDYVLKFFKRISQTRDITEAFELCNKYHLKIYPDDSEISVGLYWTVMQDALKEKRLKVEDYSCKTVDDLFELLKRPNTLVICSVSEVNFDKPSEPPESHWVLAIKTDGDNVIVADSTYRDGKTGGILTYPKEEFNKIFRDQTLESTTEKPIYEFGYCMIVSDKEINFPTK
jgi:hypothetical protein